MPIAVLEQKTFILALLDMRPQQANELLRRWVEQCDDQSTINLKLAFETVTRELSAEIDKLSQACRPSVPFPGRRHQQAMLRDLRGADLWAYFTSVLASRKPYLRAPCSGCGCVAGS